MHKMEVTKLFTTIKESRRERGEDSNLAHFLRLHCWNMWQHSFTPDVETKVKEQSQEKRATCDLHTVHRFGFIHTLSKNRTNEPANQQTKKKHVYKERERESEREENNVLRLLRSTRPSANIFPNDMHAYIHNTVKEKIGVVCHR